MGISIAMIFMAKGAKLSVSAALKDLVATWPSLPTPTKPENDNGIVSFEIGEAWVTLSLMPAPIPWEGLEGPCATSIIWENATEEVRAHRTHILVTVHGEMGKIEENKILTHVIASIVHTCEFAIGVYWGDGGLVIPKELFRELATDFLPDRNPIGLWVDFRLSQDEQGKTVAFTQGLKQLGLMDMITLASPEEPFELRDRMIGLIEYQLENGPVIKDGDTIGEDADSQSIQVKYVKSPFGHDEPVMQLNYLAAKKKKSWW